jgi:hypothetical protein
MPGRGLESTFTPDGKIFFLLAPAGSASGDHGLSETINFFMIGYASRKHSEPTIIRPAGKLRISASACNSAR